MTCLYVSYTVFTLLRASEMALLPKVTMGPMLLKQQISSVFFFIISFDGATSFDSVFQILSLINIQAHSILSQPVILSLCWMLEHKVGVDTAFTARSIQITVSQLMSVHSMKSRHNKAES